MVLPTQRTAMHTLTVWAVTRLFGHQEHYCWRKHLARQKTPRWCSFYKECPSHFVVTRYVMDTHIDDRAFPTDYDLIASACGGILPGLQQSGPSNTASLGMLSQL